MDGLVNSSVPFVSPLANADYIPAVQDLGFVGRIASQISGWSAFFTLIALAVVYDQG